MLYVASRFTWPVKTRLLALATALFFVAAAAGQSFALAPPESGAAHKCPMAMDHGQSGDAQHQCKQHRPAMPCCPMPTSQNPAPAPSPAECMARGQCCQLSEDRTRPLRNENRLERSPDSGDKAASAEQKISSPTHRRAWIQSGLRYSKPVLELKTDLRI